VPDFSFKKSERLTGSKSISSLFQDGISLSAYPVRILFNTKGTGPKPVSLAISVPKRLFKRAVDRNLLKRRIREAYRLNKPQVYTRLQLMDIKLNVVIQYQQKEILDYKTIETGVLRALDKMATRLENQV
jgi:ribonuclease P protein component